MICTVQWCPNRNVYMAHNCSRYTAGEIKDCKLFQYVRSLQKTPLDICRDIEAEVDSWGEILGDYDRGRLDMAQWAQEHISGCKDYTELEEKEDE